MKETKTEPSESRTEEIMAVLWGIAALTAWNGGHPSLATLLLIKAIMDMLCAIKIAVIQIKGDWEEWKKVCNERNKN
jgi:hypothetical protein